MTIEMSVSEKDIQRVNNKDLPSDWRGMNQFKLLKDIGSQWYSEKDKLLLKVPSAVIPEESNYIINSRHPDFQKKTKLLRVNSFSWDKRLV